MGRAEPAYERPKMNVLNIDLAVQDAYAYGYNEFEDAGMDGDPDEFDLSGFQSSARYANFVLPSLRELAGYSDEGHGTFTMDVGVLVLTQEEVNRLGRCIDPDVGKTTSASYVFDGEIYEAWSAGAHDAIQGNERDSHYMDRVE